MCLQIQLTKSLLCPKSHFKMRWNPVCAWLLSSIVHGPSSWEWRSWKSHPGDGAQGSGQEAFTSLERWPSGTVRTAALAGVCPLPRILPRVPLSSLGGEHQHLIDCYLTCRDADTGDQHADAHCLPSVVTLPSQSLHAVLRSALDERPCRHALVTREGLFSATKSRHPRCVPPAPCGRCSLHCVDGHEAPGGAACARGRTAAEPDVVRETAWLGRLSERAK